MSKITLKKVAVLSLLIGLAIGFRLINYRYTLAPNLELVTSISVLAAVAFSWRFGLIAALASMAISDLIIGNTTIAYFTWGSFAVIALSAAIMRKLSTRPALQTASSIGFAAASSFFFYVVTNFGVWLEGWYPQNFQGLVECYVAAIPFYRTMLIGNIILVPTAISIYQLYGHRVAVKKLVVDAFVG